MFWSKKKQSESTEKGKGREKRNLGRKIAELFSRSGSLDEFYEELEEMLIAGDMGGAVTMEIVDELQTRVRKGKIKDKESILEELRGILRENLKTLELTSPDQGLSLYLVLGVNGVGKTTSIAKMARYFQTRQGKKVVFAAGDTFRAAAIEQLKIQGERTGCRVIAQSHGADPGAVIFDAIDSARSRGENLILADTAGRMHNRKNLVNELKKIDKIVDSRLGNQGEYRKILVMDATTGQNGLQQAEVFHEAVDIDGVILSKYDATARGGLVVSISRKLGIPVAFVGHGEALDDLSVFDPDAYLDDLLSTDS